MADVTTIKTDVWNDWQKSLGENYLYPNLKNLSSDTTGLGSLSISGLNAYLPQLLSRLTGGGNVVSTTTQGGGTGGNTAKAPTLAGARASITGMGEDGTVDPSTRAQYRKKYNKQAGEGDAFSGYFFDEDALNNDIQNAYLQMMDEYLQNFSAAPASQTVQSIIGGTGEYQVPSYLQSAIDALTNAVNTNYWNTAAGQERIDDFSANVMPAISRKFAPSGFWSSQRTQTEDIARESLMEELAAAQSSNLTNNAIALGSMASISRALEEADLSSLMSILGLEYNTNNALMNALGLRQYDVTNIVEDDDDGDFLSSALGLAGDLGSSYVLGKMLK